MNCFSAHSFFSSILFDDIENPDKGLLQGTCQKGATVIQFQLLFLSTSPPCPQFAPNHLKQDVLHRHGANKEEAIERVEMGRPNANQQDISREKN